MFGFATKPTPFAQKSPFARPIVHPQAMPGRDSMSTPITKDRFLKTLRQSGLLTGRQYRKVLEQLPEQAKPKTIARSLVHAGVLTRFQAQHILAGSSKGYFLGPYRILDVVGQGGMGRVYKALHQTMNRTVALKVLAPHLIKTPKAQTLFQREVQAAAQLNHPNIVTAYDAGQIEGRHFLAMEFVDGPNLEQLVRAQGPIPVGQACEVIRQAALGLQSAAEHRMVHRDIKPANLLLQRGKNHNDYRVKILDFGLARLHESRGEGHAGTIAAPKNTVMGTPDFLSPEQARSLHDVDIRSDIYSLGCTFYYLLTGQVPHAGGSALEKLVRHGNEEPFPVEEFRPGLIPSVAAIVRKMMAKVPNQRYQTPDELAEELEPYSELTAFNWQRPGSESELNLATPSPARPELPGSSEFGESLVGTVPPELSLTPLSGDASDLSLELETAAPSFASKVVWWLMRFAAAAVIALGAYVAMNWHE